MRTRSWSAVVAAALIGGADACAPANTGEAPMFRAHAIDSAATVRTLDDFRGSAILLNVWATWCDPCREEMPSFQALHESYRDRGLRIVAVSIDDPDQAPLIREFVAEHGLTFEILHDRASQVMRDYPVRGVPETFLITRSGRLLGSRYVADWNSPTYRALVDSLLAAP